MVQHGRAVEERELSRARLGQKRQQLFVQAHKDGVLSCHRQLAAAENIPAEDGQRRLVDGLVIVGDAGEDEAEDAVLHVRLRLRQHVQRP